jgi:hypothetical protein
MANSDHRLESHAATPSTVSDSNDTRYSTLFAPGARSSASPHRYVVRQGTGLVVTTMVHGHLTEEEHNAIAEYRLRQYVLAGLYDAAAVEQKSLRLDPAMSLLVDRDVHLAVGDTAGRFLCYMCVQSALRNRKEPNSANGHDDQRHVHFRDQDRPRFPCETEYGLDVFGKHDSLGTVPVVRAREICRFVRNQSVQTPVDAYAAIEVVLAVTRVICDPRHEITAIVGCASPEVRRLLYRLGMPMAYAPHARIIGDNLGGSAEDDTLLWTTVSHEPGRFWPLALASSDLMRMSEYLDKLDYALAQPAAQVGQALSVLTCEGPYTPPHYIVPAEHAGGMLWTANPS